MSERQPVKSTINWMKIRDEQVPEVPENDPAVAQIRAQLRWLAKHAVPEGHDTVTGRPWADIHGELRQRLLDDIERYRWKKAGFEPTQEILDACRDKDSMPSKWTLNIPGKPMQITGFYRGYVMFKAIEE